MKATRSVDAGSLWGSGWPHTSVGALAHNHARGSNEGGVGESPAALLYMQHMTVLFGRAGHSANGFVHGGIEGLTGKPQRLCSGTA